MFYHLCNPRKIMNDLQKTNQYNLFKILSGNRPIDRGHVKKLQQSILKDNRLNLHPIIVNENYEVIDGQHRLECAKNLGLDIFYIKSDTISDEHLIDCNVNQKSFEVENYIEYFAVKEKKEDYIQLSRLMKQTKLKPKAILTLIIGNVTNNILDFLKTGKFKFPINDSYKNLLDFYCDFIAYANDKRLKPLSMFTNHNFTRAFRWLYNTTGFTKETFFNKLDFKWFELKPQRASEEWYELLISIYNFKNKDKIENEYKN